MKIDTEEDQLLRCKCWRNVRHQRAMALWGDGERRRQLGRTGQGRTETAGRKRPAQCGYTSVESPRKVPAGPCQTLRRCGQLYS